MRVQPKRPLFIFIFLALVSGLGYSQIPQVRVSQNAEIKQTVGLADVSIRYHRPGVKGRTIWGDLLPYGDIWRAGANEPTLITFSEDVSISGTPLKAGTYRFIVIPMQDGPWSVIFNSEVKNWGTVYDKQYDVARITISPSEAPHEEWMSFSFSELSGSSAHLVLRWEKIALNIPLSFDTEGIYAAKLKEQDGTIWRISNSYARYLLDYGNDLESALRMSDKAIDMNTSATTLRTKAEILGKMDRYSEAIEVMQEAIRVGKQQNPNMNTSFYEGFITRWKEMD